MESTTDLPMGFRNPVADSQRCFRAALRALSGPGEPVVCETSAPAVPGLMPATVALLLTLTDHETPVWWANAAPSRWLRFHTGAAAVDAASARFAVSAPSAGGSAESGASGFPDPAHSGTAPASAATLIGMLNAGTDEAPDRSATLLVELPSFTGGTATEWSGPGLREPRAMGLAGLPVDFWNRWQDNHARFPRGVDVLFVCGHQIVGLPRTTCVRTEPHTKVAR